MTITYRNSPNTVLFAILHMIGQSEDMMIEVKTSDIALWLGVTKQTARKYLVELENLHRVNCVEKPYRANRSKHTWTLCPLQRYAYQKSQYVHEYMLFMQQKWNMK